jgi:hypothetical protein
MLTMFFIRFGKDCYFIQIDDQTFISFSNEGDVHGLVGSFAPTFINPTGILAYMNVPQGVMNVVFSLSLGRTKI